MGSPFSEELPSCYMYHPRELLAKKEYFRSRGTTMLKTLGEML